MMRYEELLFVTAVPIIKLFAWGEGSQQRALYALGQWSRDLASSARHAEHPYSPGLMLEALVSRAQQALRVT